jgi:hypothetical protein
VLIVLSIQHSPFNPLALDTLQVVVCGECLSELNGKRVQPQIRTSLKRLSHRTFKEPTFTVAFPGEITGADLQARAHPDMQHPILERARHVPRTAAGKLDHSGCLEVFSVRPETHATSGLRSSDSLPSGKSCSRAKTAEDKVTTKWT